MGRDALETCRRVGAAPRARLRDRHPQIFAQSPAGVFLAEQAAPLQFRHDEANEIFISARDVCGGNHKAVAGALDKPLLEAVCNLLRAADDRVMDAAAAAEMDELAHGRILFPAFLYDAIPDHLDTRHFRALLI